MAAWSSQLWWRCASHFRGSGGSSSRSVMLLLLLGLLAAAGRSQNLSLEFSSDAFSLHADSFLCMGACEIGSSQVTLPSSAAGDGVGIGRLLYRTPVHFFNSSAGLSASFRTSFVFTISGASADAPIADGLVFFITPQVSIPLRSGGGALGLFEPRHDPPFAGQPVYGSSSSVVAVEIDTFCGASNTWDPGYAPHVGLDVDSLNSVAVSNVLPDIAVGSTVGVWIQYSAVARELGVRVHVVRSPDAPSEGNARSVLNYTGFDLSQFVKEESYVGFSATQGLYVQTNNISYWNFELTLPGAAADEPPPVALPVLPLASPTYAPTTLSRSGTGSTNARSSVLIVVGLPVALVTLALGFCLCLIWRGRYRERPLWPLSSIPALELSEHPQLPPAAGYGPGQISYNVLDRATDGFSTVLGRGGFGRVYRGFLQDGSQVAVKRIQERFKDGDKQVVAEVTSFARLSHKNLVPLRGWCQGHQELLLVYEYMPNGSLDSHLYPDESSCMRGALDWETRVKIIRGVADALNHLHQGREQPLVHGNVKPTSVLLDARFTARLGDFGLWVARSEDNAGTVGYFAPECEDSFKLEPYSDVFSFGVVVLEVLSGRKALDWSKPHNESDLVTWIWSLYIMGRSFMDALDPHITAACDRAEAMMLLQLGLMCCFPDPSSRPTMHVVSQFLTKSVHLPDLPKEVPPAFCCAPTTPLASKYVALMKALNSSSSLMRSSTSSMSLEPAQFSRTFITGCSISAKSSGHTGHRLCD